MKILKYIYNHFLYILSLFLLAFIPLYPKFPLTEVLPGYIVRLRIEDLIVAFAFLLFIIQLIRKKARIDWKLAKFFGLYLLVGLLSCLSALFITKTVPLQPIHIGKLFLHYFRRIEYFSLFFIFYSSARSKKQIRAAISVLGITMLAASIYGFGQKIFDWPAIQTMNREFSKGTLLYLREHARVSSTFAGHYDLSAYMVFTLPIAIAGMILRQRKERIFWGFVFVNSFYVLLLTSSRTSFIAYLAGVLSLGIFIWVLVEKMRGVYWTIGILIVSFFMMFFFSDLAGRYAHFFKVDQIKKYVAYHAEEKLGIGGGSKRPRKGDESLLVDKTDMPAQPKESETPEETARREEEERRQREGDLPPDVYNDIPIEVEESTISADGTKVTTTSAEKRTYSDTAYTFGLSGAIRFDMLWPRAINRFLKNPFLGTGYATLTKDKVTDFTYAESTDNDYLRMLGETGLLGLVTFMLIIYKIVVRGFKALRQNISRLDYWDLFPLIGFLAGTLGLLINALYIDVFEASKVAFTFWALSGLMMSLTKKLIREEN